ncbi:subfamily b member [Diplodia corticola]|uniref:Subfamily b member n=1 Tax=Diplodia corticola TaxID=236234 RepID=A0A1J9SK81_9PEZI|nr:subfamily b member [Diplodia corticola]OJD40751.1 subfamily b member [Diplodia corticola]
MAAFHESSKVVGHLKSVCDLAWKQSQTCDSAGPRFKELRAELRDLFYGLVSLEKELADSKAFLKRCDHHTEVELHELLEECVEDLREVERFLGGLSSQRHASIKALDREVSELREKLCDRRNSFQDFHDRATTAALEIMKAQLYTLVEDILSKRRQPFILTKIVDWDALADELQQPALVGRGMLEFDDVDADSDDDGVIELPDSPTDTFPPPSTDGSFSEEPQRQKKTRYHRPTVEDYVEGEDDPFPSSTTISLPSRSSVPRVDRDSFSIPAEPQENSHERSQDGATNYDPLAGAKRKHRRVDTELQLMQDEKMTIQDEIRKLKEEAEMLEEQKRTWEAEQKRREELQKFREFCSDFTQEEEEEILAECWRLPRDSFGQVTYFAMPNGALYSASTVQRRIEVRPTPALHNAFRREPSYAGHGTSSPGRRDSAIFGGSNGHYRGSPALDPYVHPRPVEVDVGAEIPGSRAGRWDSYIADSPREMSPVSGERTPTRPQPHSPLPPPRPADVVRHPIEVSLEEVFNGTQRRVTIEREIFDQRTGGTRAELKELAVPIKKGLRAGSKIKYSGVGNQGPDGVPQDVWFIVKDIPHSLFRRDGSNLHTTIEISLAESIVGWRKEVKTICNRILKVKGPKNTTGRWTKVFHDFGLPRSSDPSSRGDLIVEVDIQGPEHSGVA